MECLIFKTDIKSKRKIKSLLPILNNQEDIIDWSIDTEDIDNVLRIEAKERLTEKAVIDLISQEGYHCEVLPD